MNLNGQIMNLPCNSPALETWAEGAYRRGHRDAIHAAADLALKADACIDALRELDKRLRECSSIPASAADAYDSFYKSMVSDALAAVGWRLTRRHAYSAK